MTVPAMDGTTIMMLLSKSEMKCTPGLVSTEMMLSRVNGAGSAAGAARICALRLKTFTSAKYRGVPKITAAIEANITRKTAVAGGVRCPEDSRLGNSALLTLNSTPLVSVEFRRLSQ